MFKRDLPTLASVNTRCDKRGVEVGDVGTGVWGLSLLAGEVGGLTAGDR